MQWNVVQVAVMILSLGFIAFVTLLHIVGKVNILLETFAVFVALDANEADTLHLLQLRGN